MSSAAHSGESLAELYAEGNAVIGVDLGGTKIAAALVTPNGKVALKQKCDTPAQEGGAAVAAAVSRLVKSIAAAWANISGGQNAPAAVGIGSAGVVDAQGRSIISATDAIPGWAGTELASIVEKDAGLATTVCNDVHAHALGEMWLGAGQGASSVLMIACGTGVGGAFVSNQLEDRIMRGTRGLAGHFGHIAVPAVTKRTCSCGKVVPHLESFCSGPGLHAWYLERGGDPQVATAYEVEQRALGQSADHPADALAAQVYHDSGQVLGTSLSGLVNGLDPELVILGGGLANAGDLWWAPLQASYRAGLMELVSKVPLLRPALGGNSAIIGAGRLALLTFDKSSKGDQK